MSAPFSIPSVAALVLITLSSGRQPAAAQVGPARGALVLDGGPEASPAVARRFVELAGGVKARIVVIPTAAGNRAAGDPRTFDPYRSLFGATCCAVLHAPNRATADRADFVAPLAAATGVWISGGDPALLADTYWHTATEQAIRAVLERGGVVGGSSAGALILGARITTTHPERGFALLRNTLVIPHLNRGRAREMLLDEVAAGTDLIGLGIPEGTAIVILNDNVEVVGVGETLVVGRAADGHEPYAVLRAGDHLRLRLRGSR